MGGLARSYRRASHKLGRALLRAGSEPSARSQSEAKTVAGGWETYARRRRDEDRLGDEWNEPGVMGLDVATADEILPYLDRVVFAPFLGTNDVLLEIGPGGGRFTELLLPKCRKLIAVDTSPTMLELLRDRFGDDGRIDYQLGDGLGLGGVTSSSVDSAFSYGVFVHLQHWDIYNYLRELHRVLKPGGKAIIQHSSTFGPRLGALRERGPAAVEPPQASVLLHAQLPRDHARARSAGGTRAGRERHGCGAPRLHHAAPKA